MLFNKFFLKNINILFKEIRSSTRIKVFPEYSKSLVKQTLIVSREFLLYVWETCKLSGNEVKTNAFIEVYVVYLSPMDIWQVVCIIRVGRMSSLLHDRRLNYANEDVLSGSSLLTTLFLCRWPCLPCSILYLSLCLLFAILSYLVYLFNSLNVAKDTL